MLHQPIDDVLNGAQRVLLCGIGGGYDIVCGLPLAIELHRRGAEVHFANLTFTPLNAVRGATWHTEHLLEAGPNAFGPDYFPEKWLAAWWRNTFAIETPVWCLVATGAVPLGESYQFLAARLKVDTIIAVDGGVDSLLRGDEHSLGTPLWDALSLIALEAIEVPRKVLAATAFGSEKWDKIAHVEALERLADLTARGAFLGSESLVAQSQSGRLFLEAVEWMFAQQANARGSIVVSSLCQSLRGRCGEMPVNTRTINTPIWVSPLMALYWYCDLQAVTNSKRFLDVLRPARTLDEAGQALGLWMDAHPRPRWREIPI